MAEIVLDHLSKSYAGGVVAVDDVSLRIGDGEFMVLVGPSGCGKSTLLRLVAGLEEASQGTVAIGDTDVTTFAPRRRDIAMVFQSYALYPHMSVRQNIAYGLKVRRTPKDEAKRRVEEVAAMLGLEGLLGRRPAQLSGGQRQRMALARALAPEPDVLLLDEPFGALDARVRKELRAWLRRLHDEVHVTTIIVTHDQEEALELADSVVVMNTGRVEQVAPPRQLYDEPANAFVMSFVGPVNRLGDAWVRPHDVELSYEADGGADREAQVERVVRLGFETRVELVRDDGERLHAQMTGDDADALELEPGDIVYVRTRRERVF